ncbi:MAG TPA: glycosyltransferase [Candidatus Limnocylindrales bacterium]|nr:glycosyltransferase [Candidatus Limnocylindrales bacterium]
MEAPSGPAVTDATRLDATIAHRPLQGRRVCMFVFNDCTTDSRVLREAASLATAGGEVTIVARAAHGLPAEEARDGFVIRRVPAVALLRASLDRPGLSRAPADAPVTDRALARLRRLAQRGPRELGQIGAYRLDRLAYAVLRRTSFWTGLAWQLYAWYRHGRDLLPKADVYHAHDLPVLAHAVRHARRAGGLVVYDSHELYLESGRAAASMQPRTRRLAARLEAALLRRVDGVVTVNESIAGELVRRYGVPAPVVVRNCPPRWLPASPEPPVRDHFRTTAGLPIATDRPILLYQGSFTLHRGIERIIGALDEPELSDAVAVFLGYGAMRAWLEEQARARPGRVFVVDAVSPDVLLEWTASADVTGAPIERSTLNHYLATPNKLWESLAAGVPVVVSDFPEMARVVRESGVGEVCDPSDTRSVALAFARILRLSPEARLELRRRCRQAALERYNWETESAALIDLYRRLLGSEASAPAPQAPLAPEAA